MDFELINQGKSTWALNSNTLTTAGHYINTNKTYISSAYSAPLRLNYLNNSGRLREVVSYSLREHFPPGIVPGIFAKRSSDNQRQCDRTLF